MKCTDRYVWLLLLLLPRASVGRGEEEEREKRSVRSETCPHLDVYHRGRENMNHHLLAFLDLSLNDLYIKQNKTKKSFAICSLSYSGAPAAFTQSLVRSFSFLYVDIFGRADSVSSSSSPPR